MPCVSGLPDESYYEGEDNYAPIRDAYVEHIRKMFELAGIEYDAQGVFDLETGRSRAATGTSSSVVTRNSATTW